MPTLLKWIKETADGEPVEAIVLGEIEWAKEKVPNYDAMPKGTVLSLEEALPYLQNEFNDDFGVPKCQAITVWTKSWVIFVVQYDGSTSPHRVPRNPADHMPEMPGGIGRA